MYDAIYEMDGKDKVVTEIRCIASHLAYTFNMKIEKKKKKLKDMARTYEVYTEQIRRKIRAGDAILFLHVGRVKV